MFLGVVNAPQYSTTNSGEICWGISTDERAEIIISCMYEGVINTREEESKKWH